MNNIVSKIFFFILITPLFAFGEEKSDLNKNVAKGFFDEGFVVKKEPKKEIKKEFNKDTGFTEFEEVVPQPEPVKKIQEEKEPFAENEKELRKVLYLKAFINGDNFEHFKEQKEVVEDFCLKHKIHLMNFYVICHNCDRDLIYDEFEGLKVWVLGENLSIINKLPDIFSNITLSPSYAVGLKKGEIVLEGKALLEKYINKKSFYLGELENNKNERITNY